MVAEYYPSKDTDIDVVSGAWWSQTWLCQWDEWFTSYWHAATMKSQLSAHKFLEQKFWNMEAIAPPSPTIPRTPLTVGLDDPAAYVSIGTIPDMPDPHQPSWIATETRALEGGGRRPSSAHHTTISPSLQSEGNGPASGQTSTTYHVHVWQERNSVTPNTHRPCISHILRAWSLTTRRERSGRLSQILRPQRLAKGATPWVPALYWWLLSTGRRRRTASHETRVVGAWVSTRSRVKRLTLS